MSGEVVLQVLHHDGVLADLFLVKLSCLLVPENQVSAVQVDSLVGGGREAHLLVGVATERIDRVAHLFDDFHDLLGQTLAGLGLPPAEVGAVSLHVIVLQHGGIRLLVGRHEFVDLPGLRLGERVFDIPQGVVDIVRVELPLVFLQRPAQSLVIKFSLLLAERLAVRLAIEHRGHSIRCQGVGGEPATGLHLLAGVGRSLFFP